MSQRSPCHVHGMRLLAPVSLVGPLVSFAGPLVSLSNISAAFSSCDAHSHCPLRTVLHVQGLHDPPENPPPMPFFSSAARDLAWCLFCTSSLSSQGYTFHHPSCIQACLPFSLAFTCTHFLVLSFLSGIPRYHAMPSDALAPFAVFDTTYSLFSAASLATTPRRPTVSKRPHLFTFRATTPIFLFAELFAGLF